MEALGRTLDSFLWNWIVPVDPLNDSNAVYCDKTAQRALAVSYCFGNDGNAFWDGCAVD